MEDLQRHMAWKAIPIAGLAGGTAFLAVNMLFTPPLLQLDAGLILRYIASLVMGSGALESTAATTAVIGIIVNYILAIVFAFVIAIVIHRWGLWVGIIGGAVLGLCIYGINLYTMTMFFQWFFAINNPVLLVSHLVFGAVVGGVYESLDRYDMPLTQEVRS